MTKEKRGILKCDIDHIRIKRRFSHFAPTPEKVEQKKRKVLKGEPIKLIRTNQQGVLADGYIDYLILRQLGVTEVYVTFDKVLRNNFSFQVGYPTKDGKLIPIALTEWDPEDKRKPVAVLL